MAAKVREQMEVLVWSDKTSEDIAQTFREILEHQVWYMIEPAWLIKELYHWALEQKKIHNETGSRIQAILDKMHSPDHTPGVIKLRDHHQNIAKTYTHAAVRGPGPHDYGRPTAAHGHVRGTEEPTCSGGG